MSAHANVLVVGAGPAGLSAAYCLTKEDASVIVIEKDPVYVGGISRTVEYNGFMFDIGGDPLFFQTKEGDDLLEENFAGDFLLGARPSGLYFWGQLLPFSPRALPRAPQLPPFSPHRPP